MREAITDCVRGRASRGAPAEGKESENEGSYH